MIKHRLFFSNMQKEEDWINRVIAKGYRLKSLIPGRYQFEKLDSSYNAKTFRKETESCCGFLPIVKLDFRKFASLEDFKDYVTLFEDSGWRHIVPKGHSILKKYSQTAQMIFSLIPRPAQTVTGECSIYSLEFIRWK